MGSPRQFRNGHKTLRNPGEFDKPFPPPYTESTRSEKGGDADDAGTGEPPAIHRFARDGTAEVAAGLRLGNEDAVSVRSVFSGWSGLFSEKAAIGAVPMESSLPVSYADRLVLSRMREYPKRPCPAEWGSSSVSAVQCGAAPCSARAAASLCGRGGGALRAAAVAFAPHGEILGAVRRAGRHILGGPQRFSHAAVAVWENPSGESAGLF